MAVYCLTIQYDGSRYNGWQKQGNTPNTIQEKIELVLTRLYDLPIEIAGSGRTDAGVHALGQTASFHVPKERDHFSCEQLFAYLNQFLPEDIRIKKAEHKDDRFHARLLAKSKIYEYRLDLGNVRNVFHRRYCLFLADYLKSEPLLDLAAMKEAAEALKGTHDFKSFCDNKRMKKSTIRTIYFIDFQLTEEFLTLRFCGSGFLYHMVRILTGTLLEVGTHHRPVSDICRILEGRDRSLAGPCVPSQGLFLASVSYQNDFSA